jgi:hypothetical protein
MDEVSKDVLVSEDEQKAESEALAVVETDELRTKLAEDLGLDPDEHSDILDKAVEREQKHRKSLSDAIRQKRSWREKAKTPQPNKPAERQDGRPPLSEVPDIDKMIEQKLSERMEAQDLKTLEISDDLKAEVKDLAKLKGISIREASQHPYIKTQIEAERKQARVLAATPKRVGKSGYVSNIDPSKPLVVTDFDLNTEEGRLAWKTAREAKKKSRSEAR